MKSFIARLIPEALKGRIKSSRAFNRLPAKKLASTSKRVDICAAQFAHFLHLSNHPSLRNKVCLEIGCGWVLSHAAVCYLLGAKKVIATDITTHAQPESLLMAIHKSIASIPRDILSPFEDHSLIRKRFDNLLSIRHFDFKVLQDLGIEYVSPIDFARERLNTPVDFVYSNSVLEHVPGEDVPALLKNIASDLTPGGTMIHCIHLEDHKNFTHRPFDFLAISSGSYPQSLERKRGNRLRKSRWKKLFNDVQNTESQLIYKWTRTDKELPSHVDQSVHHTGESDLRVSHIGVYTRKHV